jgi:hypothetical protein
VKQTQLKGIPKMQKPAKAQKSSNGSAQPPNTPELRVQIEKRAHEIWLSSGCSDGNDVSHWLQAEHEVLAERQKNSNQTL